MSKEPLVVIDCDSCTMRDTDVCHDCVMSFLCRDDPTEAVVFDLDEIRAMRVLADAGLVPSLRHRASGHASAS